MPHKLVSVLQLMRGLGKEGKIATRMSVVVRTSNILRAKIQAVSVRTGAGKHYKLA